MTATLTIPSFPYNMLIHTFPVAVTARDLAAGTMSGAVDVTVNLGLPQSQLHEDGEFMVGS